MKAKAIGMLGHGGPEVFSEVEYELPDAPPPGYARVRVEAAALNHLDLWFRRGLPHIKLTFPHRLGSDFAGTVVAHGPLSTGAPPIGAGVMVAPGVSCGQCLVCRRGDDNQCRDFKIFGEFIPGAMGELVDVPVENLFAKPANLSFAEAAAMPMAFLTAWALVVQKGQVTMGETVLVHAAASGVSSAAIQLARHAGARVIATTSDAAKAERARALGAHEVIDTSKASFVDEVKRLTNKLGVDVAVDHVGGEVFSKSLGVLALGGRMITCGATSGAPPAFDLARVYMRYNQIIGTRMGPKHGLDHVLRLQAQGAVRSVVGATLPFTLEGVREAHETLENRKVFGKVVLERKS